jgi:hypothetical protein
MAALERALEALFGHGDDDFPLWLAIIRVHILLWAACTLVSAAGLAVRLARGPASRADATWVASLTALAAALRFVVVPSNLMDLGGIAYSRLLLGYRGNFATAQVYALVYRWTARDMDHALLINRVAGTLTVPLVYALCRLLSPADLLPAALAAGILALYPLHALLSASDALSIFSLFLCALSYVMLLAALRARAAPAWLTVAAALSATLGLGLLTQVRYENALLLLPAAFALVRLRRGVRLLLLAPGVVATGALLALHAWQSAAAGSSFHDATTFATGLSVLYRFVLLNPFFGAWLLLAGLAAAVLRVDGWSVRPALLMSVAAVCVVAAVSDEGHHAGRLLCNWLLWFVVPAAYGYAALLRSPRTLERRLAAVGVALLAALPLVAARPLRAQYLEMIEHDVFRAAVGDLPPSVAIVLAPDDEIMRRSVGSTIEALVKYQRIREGVPGARVEVVGLTRFLEHPGDVDCAGGRCAYFRGLPCMRPALYPGAQPQCDELERTRALEPLRERVVTAAPFLPCSVYVWGLERRLCTPEVREERFGMYLVGPLAR